MNKIGFKMVVFLSIQIIGLKSTCYAETELVRIGLGGLCGSGNVGIQLGPKLGEGSGGTVYASKEDDSIVIKKSQIAANDYDKINVLLKEINNLNCLAETGIAGYVRSPQRCISSKAGATITLLQYSEKMRYGTLQNLITSKFDHVEI